MDILVFARRAIFATSFLGFQFSAFAQGNLTPPGAPAPTMKSLDQIEARTPVDAIHTPGDFSDEFIISQPGSYYLTTNIVGVNAKYGILITTNNVTLDLNGFSILGVPGGYGGISVPQGPYYYLAVRNGTISGWAGSGISSYIRNSTFENLNISGNLNGIVCLDNTVIQNCNISSNAIGGITVSGNGCTILDNVCNGNNSTNGINNASIYLNSANNRVEGNHICGSGVAGSGIFVIGVGGATNNIIVRNSVISGGTKNYSVNASQIVGPLITNAVSGFITNSNPWANFSF
jgi:hypothetical protein